MKTRITFYLYIISLIMISLNCRSTCGKVEQRDFISSFDNNVIYSRKQALKSRWKEEKILEYQVLGKHQCSSLQYLFDFYTQISQQSGRLNIIENYDANTNRYAGIFWMNDTVFTYRYDIKFKQLLPLKMITKMSEYPNNPDIHKDLIIFYNTFSWEKGFRNLPASGRSNNGYYIYTEIILKPGFVQTIKSITMRQW